MDKFNFLKNKIDTIKKEDLFRQLVCFDSAQGPEIFCENGNKKVLFCSNNYLNLANDPTILETVKKAIDRYGFGSGASRLISGTMTPHLKLEKEFADFLQKEAALFFPSGWTANEAVITTLPQKGDIVLLDKMDHASIINAAHATEAEFRTFRRDSLSKLEKHLADSRYQQRYIVTESIFSMDGDRANLAELVSLKNKYNAVLILDEAHSIGCMGPSGAGLAEDEGLLNEIDIMIAPLGKAFAANGAIVASDSIVIDYLINKARPFIYTTAPSPVLCEAVLAALEIVINEPQRRIQLKQNAHYLLNELKKLKLNTGHSNSHIIPVILGDIKKTLRISHLLWENGFFVAAIRPPTVAIGSSRLRISVQCGHTKEHINGLLEMIRESVL